MQRGLFLASPSDAYRAKVVSSKWVGPTRVVADSSILDDRLAARKVPTIAVVLVTSATASDASVRDVVERAVQAGVPVIGVDASKVPDQDGAFADPGGPWPEFQRYYKWVLDNGKLEIGEWIDYELAHPGA